MSTPKAGLKTMPTGTLKNEQIFNEAVILLEALLYRGVASRAVLDPSGISPSPSNGDIYLINDGSPTSTGDWSGQGGKIAVYFDGWRFLPPDEGLTLWITDEAQRVQYRSGVWVDVNEEPPQELSDLSDVDLTGSPSPSGGQTLVYSAALGKWVAGSAFSGVRAELSVNFAITLNTNEQIEWDQEDYDTDEYHSISSNKEQFVIPSDGKYEIVWTWTTLSTAAANYQCFITLDGTAFGDRIAYLMATNPVNTRAGGTLALGPKLYTAGQILRCYISASISTSVLALASSFTIKRVDT